jgi:hypothetical protein
VIGAIAARTGGGAARVAIAPDEGVIDPSRRIMYNRPMLFDLKIMFLVERSFTDKPNGSNFIEH